MADFVQHPVIQTLAWALVHFLWQGAAIGLAAAIAFRVVRNAPSLRYAIGVGALVAMLAAPVTTMVVLTADRVAPASMAAADSLINPDPATLVESLAGAPAAPAAGSLRMPPQVLAGAVVAWLVGVAFFSIRLMGGWLVARRLARRAVQPASDHIQAVARQLADRLAIKHAVAILQSSAVVVPVMVGWLKPAVLLPAAAIAGLSPSQLEALLAHELAHVRRHDYLVNILQSVAEALLFYHPAVWWLSQRVRAERELCCDDLAVSVSDPLVYATALTDLAAMASPGLALAATDGDLLDRVRRILGQSDGAPTVRAGAMPLLALVLVAGVAVPVALASTQTPVAVRPAEVVAPQPTLSAPVITEAPVITLEGRAVVRTEGEHAVVLEADRVTLQQTTPQTAQQQAEQQRTEELKRKIEELQRALAQLERQRVETARDLATVEARKMNEVSQTARELAQAKADLASLRERGMKPDHPDYRRVENMIRELTNAMDKEALHWPVSNAQMASERQQAEAELARIKTLVERGLASEQQLRDAQAAVARAERTGSVDAFVFAQLKESAEKLARSRELVEKGLVPTRDLATQEEVLRQLELQMLRSREERARAIDGQAAVFERLRRDLEVRAAERLRDASTEGQPVAANEPVRVGDYLRLDIDGEDMRMNYRVGDDGTIKMPLIGAIKVVGLTAAQVRDTIGKQLAAHKLKTVEQVKVTLTRVVR